MIKLPPAPVAIEPVASPVCWRCGAPRTVPSPASQIKMLRDLQRTRPVVFQWSETELSTLEARLTDGDAIIWNCVYIQSLKIRRSDGSIVEIFRKELRG